MYIPEAVILEMTSRNEKMVNTSKAILMYITDVVAS